MEDIDFDEKIPIDLDNGVTLYIRLALLLSWDLLDIIFISDRVFFSVERNGVDMVRISMNLSDYNRVVWIKRELSINDLLNDTLNDTLNGE